MKSTTGVIGGSTPLQVLRKNESRLSTGPLKRSLPEGKTSDGKRDKVKEYMEQKFYEQFMPNRDANSRIRKLSLDKDTIKRTRGQFKKRIVAADNKGLVSGSTSLKKRSSTAAKKQRKQKASLQSYKNSNDICSMILSDIRDI